MTLGLGVITRNKEVDILDRALASVYGKVDNIYITHSEAGVEPSDDLKALAKKYKAQLSHFDWIDDFAAARNFNMSQCKDEWYTWLDSDDTVRGMEKAKDFLNKLRPNATHVFCVYEYAYFPGGQVRSSHPKERFMRLKFGMEWKGYLHETCVLKDGDVVGVSNMDIVWEHHPTDERTKESGERNIRVIEKEIRDQSEKGKIDPRTVLNLGMALNSAAQMTQDPEDWQRSIRAFYRYLEMSGWDVHAYMAWRNIGLAFVQLNRFDLALNAYFECIKLHPEYKDAYALIGNTYLNLNDIKRAKPWLELAMVAGVENEYASDKSVTTVQTILSLAEISAKEGKLDAAEKHLKFALKYTKTTDENVMKMLKIIQQQKRENKKADQIAHTLKTKEDYERLEPKWQAHPKVVSWRNLQTWKTSTSGKEITIFCGQSWEEWTPDNEKTGIGGSEEAVINMAREMHKMGYEVTVYGSHGFEVKNFEGVTYAPFWTYNPNEPTDIFIGWRDPAMFDLRPKAKKTYLWLHDVVSAATITEERLKNIDKVMVLSAYHRNLYPHIKDEQIFLTGNGINPKHFEDLPKKPFKIMYASAPNRGLKCLLEMWPKIKERVPEAELYWAYGWKTHDLASVNNPLMRRFKEEVVALLKQPGVYELGRIGHQELAKHMAEASVWAYPTEFPEVFCITAVKMQASGAIPVHTGVAAIGEKYICPFGTNLDIKDIYTNPEAQNRFIEVLIDTLNNPQPREEMKKWAKETWSWENTAKNWIKEFYDI